MASLSDVVRILVTQDTRGLTRVGFGTPMLVGYHTVTAERAKVYTKVSDMKTDGFQDAADYPDSNALISNAVLSGPQPTTFDFATGGLPQTVDVALNGAPFTVDFNATPAEATSQAAPGGTFDFSLASDMTVDIDGTSFLVSFAPGDFAVPAAVPPSEAATVLDANMVAAGFAGTEYSVTVPPGTNTVRITTTALGTSSSITITAGAPDANAIFGFPTVLQPGAGDFADASVATVAEVVSVLQGDLTAGGATSFLVSEAANVITISTVNVGPSASVQIQEPTSGNANALLGFPTQLIQGSAGNGDIDDPILTAARAMFSQSTRVPQVIVGRSDSKPGANFRMVPVVKDNHRYTLEVNGETFTFTSDGGATASEIADGMAAAVNLGVAGRNGIVAAVSSGGAITFTAPGSVSGSMALWGNPNDWNRFDQSVDPGTLAEVTAIQLENDDWYGLIPTFNGAAELEALAAGLGGLGEKLLGGHSADTNIINSSYIAGSGSDVASNLKDTGNARVFVSYHSRPHAQVSAGWMGVMFPKDPGSATWHLKTVRGVPISELNSNQQAHAESKSANHYQALSGRNVTQTGITSGGEFIDTTRFVDFIRQRLREDIFATLSGVDKVPYTDEGGAVVENIVRGVIRLGISVGGFAADPEPVITVPRVADQNPVDRANRLFPGGEASATLAGAIHKMEVQLTVSV